MAELLEACWRGVYPVAAMDLPRFRIRCLTGVWVRSGRVGVGRPEGVVGAGRGGGRASGGKGSRAWTPDAVLLAGEDLVFLCALYIDISRVNARRVGNSPIRDVSLRCFRALRLPPKLSSPFFGGRSLRDVEVAGA